MPNENEYTTKDELLESFLDSLSLETRQKRIRDAYQKKIVIKKILLLIEQGSSEREAIEGTVDWRSRTSLRVWINKYETSGIDGLIDRRIPINDPVPEHIQDIICTFRYADPNYDVNKIVENLLKNNNYKISGRTVCRILSENNLNRPPGPSRDNEHAGEIKLAFGGMKLVEAADVKIGYSKALSEGIAECLDKLPEPEIIKPLDRTGRDKEGHFLSSYNERYKKTPGDVIGPGFASVEQKREDLVPDRLHVKHVSTAIIERKILALLVSPLLIATRERWDGIRTYLGKYLGELCGYEYMPSTLELFTRELKYAGVANTLWEIHARLWLSQTRHWGTPQKAAVLFVDGTTKPLWTNLFSQSTKVSSTGRVMPGLEMVSFHTGYGVPIWIVTKSGRAPLTKVVPELLTKLPAITGDDEIGRIVVIDAEGSSVPYMKGLDNGTPPRAWIIRLKQSMFEGKETYATTPYAPYRDGDQIRWGLVDLNDPDGGKYRAQFIELNHRTKNSSTHFAVSNLLNISQWGPEDLVDLYFERWPYQEANFRAVNRAVGFKDVHGYGKQLVDNIAVITEQEQLGNRITQLQLAEGQKQSELVIQEFNYSQELLDERVAKARQRKIISQLENRLSAGNKVTEHVSALVQESKELERDQRQRESLIKRQQKEIETNHKKTKKINQVLQKKTNRQAHLTGREQIFKSDVELDSIFSVLKFGLVALVVYVLKELFGGCRMEPLKFLNHLATLPATLRITPTHELLMFGHNTRDPMIMELLQTHVESINAMQLLMRSGKILQIQVAPKPSKQKKSRKKKRSRREKFRGQSP